jgi:hypothetical protein
MPGIEIRLTPLTNHGEELVIMNVGLGRFLNWGRKGNRECDPFLALHNLVKYCEEKFN